MANFRGTLFVISGPSGVGKGTIIESVFKKIQNLVFSVSFTTRLPRPQEKDGVDYFFVDKKKFKEMIQKDEFLEWALVHNNHYGTPSRFVEEMLSQGKDVILDVDVQGAQEVMKKKSDIVSVFIAPPGLSKEVLKSRLLKRDTETQESVEIRLKNAQRELSSAGRYKYIVFNDLLKEAVDDLSAIIRAQRCKTFKYFKESNN